MFGRVMVKKENNSGGGKLKNWCVLTVTLMSDFEGVDMHKYGYEQKVQANLHCSWVV